MKCIEKYLFKTRNVYITDINNKNELKPVEKKPGITVDFYDLKNEELRKTLFQIYEKQEVVENYSQRTEEYWKLIIAYYKEKPIAAFWILEPREKVFYDSIEIDRNQLLFCSVYVNPEYRGQGIYNQMHNKAFEYWETNCKEREVITVVEKNNLASNKSNQKYGLKIMGKNYLIKFLGKNLVSVYKTKEKTKIWILINEKKVLR
ncbi:MAG: GNAT family N-acetyltransferase [Peptococcaceae bacterium]|nr:GNAT family N-acetyltransferase [Peptococcaceae bacterium]